MAFRNDDRNFEWPQPGHHRANWPQRHAGDEQDDTKLSLNDTLRELAVTVVGFVGVIVLIVALVSYFRA